MSRDISTLSYRPHTAPPAPPQQQRWFNTSRKYIYIRNNSKYNVTIIVSSNPNTCYNRLKQIGLGGGPVKAQLELYEHHKDIISFKTFGTYKTGKLNVNSSSFYVNTFIWLEDGICVQIKKEPCEKSDYEYIIDDDDIVVNSNGKIMGNHITVVKEINKIELL